MILVKNAGISFILDTNEYKKLKETADFATYERIMNFADGCILSGNDYNTKAITTKYSNSDNYEELFETKKHL